jgi:DNA-binding NarL/FixJ family response regulator
MVSGEASPLPGERGVRVLLVDDHALLAQTLALELRHAGCQVHVVDTPSHARVLAAADAFRADVVLLDLYLGRDVGTSVPLIAPLAAGGAEVVVLTGMTDEMMYAACIDAGATGVLSKEADFDGVLRAVLLAATHERVQPAHERDRLLERLRLARREERERLTRFERLTGRERAVLAALMDGRSAAEIAEDSYVSLATVRSQIRAILQKLDVTSQLAAVAAAHHAGWDFDGQLSVGALGADLSSAAVGAA